MAAPVSLEVRGPGAIEILDEALGLLRTTPPALHAIYYLATLPWCLGLIYFCTDMSESANAPARLPGEALLLALLYFWMKTGQAVYARRLLARLEGGDVEPWTARRWLNTALLQAVFAGSWVVLYPLALVVTIPFAWVHAFYHTVSVLGTGAANTVRASLREAAGMARLWPKQNHLLIGTGALASFILFINLGVFFYLVPHLLNSLLGIQTVFEESVSAFGNVGFYLDVAVFCYLLLNPLSKAVYALRCFYGRARLSGADLRAELRRLRPVAGLALVVLVMALVVGFPTRADEGPIVPPAPAVATDPSAVALDRAIAKTLQKDEFAWRMPRAEQPAGEAGFWTKLLQGAATWLRDQIKHWTKALGDFLKWLFDQHKPHDAVDPGLPFLASVPWHLVLFSLAVVLVGVLAFILVRRFRPARTRPLASLAVAPSRTVDLAAEEVRADDLPEDSWLALAQQMIEQGEFRLALRAFYLATLASLARQELVRLGATKSNRDYLAELTRRLRGDTAVLPGFRDNVRLFEASWYGTHDVTLAMLETMRLNQQQVRGHVAA